MSALVEDFIAGFNRDYEAAHKNYEDNFWATKMNLTGNSKEELTRTKSALDDFLGNKDLLLRVREMMKDASVSGEQMKVLKIFEKTFLCYIIEDPLAKKIKDETMELEASLGQSRNFLALGYTNASGDFVKCSSVQLRNVMRTSESEAMRESAYNGLRTIGPFVAEKFCQIIKKRNILAKSLGYEDFYDMKVTQAEGFSKKVLFEILDDLEIKTRPILNKALAALKEAKGERAALPFNQGFYLSGETTALKDPYFPFENAVDAWVRSFAALGISYENATMSLDLVDREGKYSNGFCHWPQPSWINDKNEWVPSQANFTSLASPKSVGSGLTALTTLMHEGGHAAHFANVKQRSPLFSQERSPTSVAYAENQSMFLDSLVGDAAWQARYALSKTGEPIPWDVIEKDIRGTHEFAVFGLRAMIAVPYYEKALYELPDDQVTPEVIIALADQIENSIQGGLSARPLLSVPHILSDESAAYYHGYCLAELSVHQTRAYFMSKYGELTDNNNIGRELTEVYWRPGNSEIFLDLVQKLTGRPLTADAWIAALQEDLEELVVSERKAYQDARAKGPSFPRGSEVDIKMRIKLVHGDLVIADSASEGLFSACETYRKWIETV